VKSKKLKVRSKNDVGPAVPSEPFIYYMTDRSETGPYRAERMSVGSTVLSGPFKLNVGFAVSSEPFTFTILIHKEKNEK